MDGSAELCVLQLTARGEVSPGAGVDIYGSAAISIFLVRAGAKVNVHLLNTKLVGAADINFASVGLAQTFELCFDLSYTTEPLSAEFFGFVQIRDKIK